MKIFLSSDFKWLKMPHHSFYSLIGKPVVEKYGRFKGRVLAFELDDEGNVKNIIFENGGVILYKNIKSFEFHDDYLVFLPSLVKEGRDYIKEYRDLSLYLNTLKKIFGIEPNKLFVSKYYRQLKNKYEKLDEKVGIYIKKLKNRKVKIENELNRLKNAIFTLHMGRENGFIDSSIYQMVYDFLSNEILRYTSELEDLEHIEVDLTDVSSRVFGLLKEFEEVLGGEEEEIKYS